MNELIEQNESRDLAESNELTQYDKLIEISIKKGADINQIEKLIDLKIKYDNEQARKAFSFSMSQFKKNPPKVFKDLTNKQYNSAYSSIGNTVNVVSKSLGEYGFSTRWDYSYNNSIICVKCIITHDSGHSESCESFGPNDTSGKKNELQQMKSTRTYLKLETFEAVTGIASEFVNLNDDGNNYKEISYISDNQENTIKSMIENNELDISLFKKWAKISELNEIKSENYQKVISKINESIKIKKCNQNEGL